MKLSFHCYALGSIAAILALLAFTSIVHESMYTALLFLSNARICTAIIYNFLLAAAIWLIRAAIWLFLGRLRDHEMEQVRDSASGFVTDTVMFLILTIPTRNGVEASTLVLFQHVGFVVVMKGFHLLCHFRVVHMFESTIPTWSSMGGVSALMILLLVSDVILAYLFFCAISVESSLQLWLLFEFLGMFVSAIGFTGKFCLNYIDLQLDGWAGKSAAIFILDVFVDVLSLLFVLIFMSIYIFQYPSQLPIHMTANVIHVARTLAARLKSFRRCRVLVNEMTKRFPEATFEELEAADECIICRDLLNEGSRKLPCSHVFHMDCLRAWFVQQQTCPTCRSDVLADSHEAPAPSAVPPAAEDVEVAGDSALQRVAAWPARHVMRAVGRATQWVGRTGGTTGAATGTSGTSSASRGRATRWTKATGWWRRWWNKEKAPPRRNRPRRREQIFSRRERARFYREIEAARRMAKLFHQQSLFWLNYVRNSTEAPQQPNSSDPLVQSGTARATMSPPTMSPPTMSPPQISQPQISQSRASLFSI